MLLISWRSLGCWSLGAALMVGPATSSGAVRLIATDGLVAVLDGADVRIYSGDGRLLTRLASSAPAATGTDSDPQAEERRERIFELHDVATDQRDSQAAEDLIEEDLTLAQRRRPSGAGASHDREQDEENRRVRAAADGSGGLYLALQARLVRLGADLLRVVVGPVPGPVQFLEVDDAGRVVLATPSRLLVSGDGGRTFAAIARLDRPPTHLALDPAGRWVAWADGAAVHVLGPSGQMSLPLGPRLRDLRSCEGHLVLLTDSGLLVGPNGQAPVATSGPLPAHQLICPRAGPAPWIAVGDGLLESRDQGRSFRSRVDAPAERVLGAALTRDRIWVATSSGIRTLATEPASGSASAVASPDPALAVDGDPDARPWPRWAALVLPRLTLAASYQSTGRRRDWRALAIAEVPLGGPDPRLRPAPTLARRLLLSQPAPAEQALPALPDPSQAGGPPPPLAPPHPTQVPLRPVYPPPDRDAPCLAPVRARAVAGAQAEAERARSLVGRAGHAAWLPELRLRAEKRMGRSESLDVRGTASMPARDALGLDASNDVRYEVRATWDLPRLIFSPEEVAAVQQALRMADMRREIEAQVNRVYFERRRLLVNPAPHPAVEDTGALLRVEELEAELDALSAGEFSRCRGVGTARLGP